jgi:hypothetical protein
MSELSKNGDLRSLQINVTVWKTCSREASAFSGTILADAGKTAETFANGIEK